MNKKPLSPEAIPEEESRGWEVGLFLVPRKAGFRSLLKETLTTHRNLFEYFDHGICAGKK